MTPEQAAHDLRDPIVRLPGGFMTAPTTYERGAELGFEGADFYLAGRAGVLGEVPADVVVAAPPGTDPGLYEGTGATWVLVTGWLDELRGVAAVPPTG